MEMRTRESASSTTPEATLLNRSVATDSQNGFYYPGTPNIVTSEVISESAGSTMTRTFKDVVTPDFRKRVASGEIINNPMESETIVELDPSVNLNYNQCVMVQSYSLPDYGQHETPWIERSLSGTCNFDFLTTGAPSELISYPDIPDISAEVQKRIDIATAKAHANIGQSEILMLAALAESKSTVAGLIQLMAKATKIIASVAHGHPDLKRLRRQSKKKGFSIRKLKRALDETAEIYMNARYNLRPLYYDICGLLRLFEDKPRYDRYTFRGFSSFEEKTSEEAVYTHPEVKNLAGATLNLKFMKELATTIEVRAGVLTQLEDASIWTRMGFNSIPATIYDLVPFSFIADWFFNIGDTILSWVPEYGSTVLASWAVVKKQFVQRQKIVVHECESESSPIPWQFPHSYEMVSCSIGNANRQKITTVNERIINPSRPILPHIDVNLDMLKLLDLAIISKKLLVNRKIMTGVV